MARRNSRFVNQKVIVGNKSIQAEDLTDSARESLSVDSDFVKTVNGLDGSKISNNSINPSAITDQDQLVSSTGALTTGGILTISRNRRESFINFEDTNPFSGQDSSLSVFPNPAGFDFISKYKTPSLPLNLNSRLTVNLKTPTEQFQKDLLHFFSVNAGAEDDEIHSVQILDSTTENDYDYYVDDDDGNFHYLKLLDSIPYGDPRLSTAGGDNEVDIIDGQRLWQGIKGAKLANSTPEFGSAQPNTGLQTRNIASRLRFRTRKSVPSLEVGGAPSTFKTNAPEGPIGIGVSSPVYSKVSSRFVYKVVPGSHFQGFLSGYSSGGLGPGSAISGRIDKFPFATDAGATNVGSLSVATRAASGQSSNESGYTSGGRQDPGRTNLVTKFPFANDGSSSPVGTLTQSREELAGQSSTTHGYSSGGITTGATNRIDKFPFASDGAATTVGNLGIARYGLAGHSSSDYGYTAGGRQSNPTFTTQNIIDRFPFASDAGSSSVGTLTRATRQVTGTSSDAYGYSAGGEPSNARQDNIDRFPFAAAPANASDVGDLANPKYAAAGQASTGQGYFSGGYGANTIEKFPFAASTTNATSVGGLSLARFAVAGQQV